MRTPLTTINGLLEGMAYGALPEEYQEQCINLMRKETTRLIRLVNENLDYEKSRSGELVLAKTNFDATSAINDVVSQLHKMAEDVGDSFIVKLPPLLNVYADKDRFIQIIMNIAKNALQFTRDGTITISGEKHGNDTMISIADTGIGMTDEEINNMWERYYKADPSRKVAKYGESGIGMAVVHQLLQLHHAKACVDSAPGKGTTFTLLFPGEAIASDGSDQPQDNGSVVVDKCD